MNANKLALMYNDLMSNVQWLDYTISAHMMVHVKRKKITGQNCEFVLKSQDNRSHETSLYKFINLDFILIS